MGEFDSNRPDELDTAELLEIAKKLREGLLDAGQVPQELIEAGKVIVLTAPDGARLVPGFQFMRHASQLAPDEGGESLTVHEVVGYINKVLGAAGDPEGAARWWFSAHPVLSSEGNPGAPIGVFRHALTQQDNRIIENAQYQILLDLAELTHREATNP